MAEIKEPRLLKASEIEVRVNHCSSKGSLWLLYKDARVDMKLLDETYGVLGWKRHHRILGDRLYCIISIWDPEKGQWISKEDVGTESKTEKEKGQASDAFKRAGFNCNIGRELYTGPFIWISNSVIPVVPMKDNPKKYELEDEYTSLGVSEVEYDNERVISRIVLVDLKHKDKKVVYEYDAVKGTSGNTTGGNSGSKSGAGDRELKPNPHPLLNAVNENAGKKIDGKYILRWMTQEEFDAALTIDHIDTLKAVIKHWTAKDRDPFCCMKGDYYKPLQERLTALFSGK